MTDTRDELCRMNFDEIFVSALKKIKILSRHAILRVSVHERKYHALLLNCLIISYDANENHTCQPFLSRDFIHNTQTQSVPLHQIVIECQFEFTIVQKK